MLKILYGPPDRVGIYNLCYLLAAGLTCWSGTRAAVLAICVAGLIALASRRRLPDGKMLIRVGVLSALAMLGAITFAPANPEFSLFMRDNLCSVNALSSGRLALWQATFDRWYEAPLFGWGSGSTFWEVYVNWWHTQPHNTILLFLISWGIVGATGALWLLGRAIVATHSTGMNNDVLVPISGALYSLLAMSMFAGMLHYPRFVMLIMFCFAILLAAGDRANEAHRTDRPPGTG
jgi:O-antigen ligase